MSRAQHSHSSAARQAAALFALSGVLALMAIPSEPHDAPVLLGIAAADLTVTAVALAAPWQRWPHGSTAWLGVAGLAILGFSTWAFGGFAAGTGPFFVLLFAWLGLHHGRRVIIGLSPLAALSYAGGLVAASASARLVSSTIVLIPVATAVGLVIARRVRALEQARDQVEQANQFKIDLLGMLGHELGNPLTAIQWYAELGGSALDTNDTAKAQDALKVVDRNAAEIRRVLSEILTMVRSERGALTAQPQPCLLEPRLRSAVSTLVHRPSIECPAGLSALVQPGHLEQILVNLLSNAEKYAGGATRVVAGPAGPGHVEISVFDAGPGLRAEFRDHVFERFSRSAETAQKVMGTGLGLFITRELARANGGDISHRDAIPTGSVFVVTLPRVT